MDWAVIALSLINSDKGGLYVHRLSPPVAGINQAVGEKNDGQSFGDGHFIDQWS